MKFLCKNLNTKCDQMTKKINQTCVYSERNKWNNNTRAQKLNLFFSAGREDSTLLWNFYNEFKAQMFIINQQHNKKGLVKSSGKNTQIIRCNKFQTEGNEYKKTCFSW